MQELRGGRPHGDPQLRERGHRRSHLILAVFRFGHRLIAVAWRGRLVLRRARRRHAGVYQLSGGGAPLEELHEFRFLSTFMVNAKLQLGSMLSPKLRQGSSPSLGATWPSARSRSATKPAVAARRRSCSSTARVSSSSCRTLASMAACSWAVEARFRINRGSMRLLSFLF